jgi:hypothetical protein
MDEREPSLCYCSLATPLFPVSHIDGSSSMREEKSSRMREWVRRIVMCINQDTKGVFNTHVLLFLSLLLRTALVIACRDRSVGVMVRDGALHTNSCRRCSRRIEGSIWWLEQEKVLLY